MIHSSALTFSNEGRSCTGSEFGKGCVLIVAEEIPPHDREIFQNACLHSRTCTYFPQELRIHLFEQFNLQSS
jgi:hypothetical protein